MLIAVKFRGRFLCTAKVFDARFANEYMQNEMIDVGHK